MRAQLYKCRCRRRRSDGDQMKEEKTSKNNMKAQGEKEEKH
jgi:hypothetical protein